MRFAVRIDQRKKIIAFLKDKVSLIRASLLFTCTASASAASRIAVIRATSREASRINTTDLIAIARVQHLFSKSLIDRLNTTKDASVALRCLLLLHAIWDSDPSFSTIFSSRGHSFLNFSTFRDDSDLDLSAWVRWFAAVFEQNLIASPRVLTGGSKGFDGKSRNQLSMSRILNDLDSWTTLVEQVSDAPESLHLQKKNSVYEAVMAAGKDYGFAQREISLRLRLLSDRIGDLNPADLVRIAHILTKLEDYRNRLTLLLVNRRRNQPFWDLICRTKEELARKQRGRDDMALVTSGRRDESHELTLYVSRIAGRPEQLFRFPESDGDGGRSSPWLDNKPMLLTVAPV